MPTGRLNPKFKIVTVSGEKGMMVIPLCLPGLISLKQNTEANMARYENSIQLLYNSLCNFLYVQNSVL